MSESNKPSVSVLVGIDSNGVDPCVFGRSNHANSNFAPVGDQDFAN
jgi:hypothetical protein